MTIAPHQLTAPDASTGDEHARALARQLAAAGLGVQVAHHRDTCQLTILGVAGGKSFLTLSSSGQARWYYEPATGPSTSPLILTEIIGYLLGAPHRPQGLTAYRALPLKDRSAGPCRT